MSTDHEKALNRDRQARWRAANLDRARAQSRAKSERFRQRHPQRVALGKKVVQLKKRLSAVAGCVPAECAACCPVAMVARGELPLSVAESTAAIRRGAFDLKTLLSKHATAPSAGGDRTLNATNHPAEGTHHEG